MIIGGILWSLLLIVAVFILSCRFSCYYVLLLLFCYCYCFVVIIVFVLWSLLYYVLCGAQGAAVIQLTIAPIFRFGTLATNNRTVAC